jgi:hypothetical protein
MLQVESLGLREELDVRGAGGLLHRLGHPSGPRQTSPASLRYFHPFQPLHIGVADPNPGSGAFLTPGSEIWDPGWVKIRIRIRDEYPGSYFREFRNHFVGLKYFNFLMRVRDPV